jgi:hypothetical protein
MASAGNIDTVEGPSLSFEIIMDWAQPAPRRRHRALQPPGTAMDD